MSEQKKKRSYYAKIAIVGESGGGKTYLSKTADRNKTAYIHTEDKPLSYKLSSPWKFEGKPKTWAGFMKNLKEYGENPEIENIIIDSQTQALLYLNHEMGKTFTGWDVPKNYNKQLYEYLTLLKSIQKDIIVISHDEFVKNQEGVKERRMMVHNQEWAGKLEQAYTIVLFTGKRVKNGKPEFFLSTFSEDTSSKTPEGLFPDKNGDNLAEIPNDAAYIFKALEEYYTI